MAGYWCDTVVTAAAFVGDWLRTGDIGRIDDDGRLSIVDRMIITGGENVSSREVEDALSSHPDVGMVSVVGVPDDYWGEAVCAVVVAHPHRHSSAEALIMHVREKISPFKRPRHVLFVNDLPMTTNGKVAKEELRWLIRDAVRTRGVPAHMQPSNLSAQSSSPSRSSAASINFRSVRS
jgi:acyl-CoA synthetase (AMP-forming)/AMP-acid ligase II